MRKNFIVSIYCEDNGKKIQLIKEVRGALGIGLVEAKDLVERCQYEQQDYILNATQVTGLMVAATGEASGGSFNNKPLLTIRKVVPVPANNARDFSNVEPTLYS